MNLDLLPPNFTDEDATRLLEASLELASTMANAREGDWPPASLLLLDEQRNISLRSLAVLVSLDEEGLRRFVRSLLRKDCDGILAATLVSEGTIANSDAMFISLHVKGEVYSRTYLGRAFKRVRFPRRKAKFADSPVRIAPFENIFSFQPA
jgi:hypothetical protein